MKLDRIEYPEAGVCLLTFSATAEELEAGAQAVYEEKRSTFTIKGFEKGEADRAQIEAVRGEHVFWYDAINNIMDADVPALLEAAVAEEHLSVEGEPNYDLVSVKKDEGFVATATLALTPVLTVGSYTGFTAKCSYPAVTEKEIDEVLQRRLLAGAELVPHKGPAVKGNTVHLTYVGVCEGKEFTGGSAEKMAIELGRGRMIPGFEEGILGHKEGDEFDINVTFPVNYQNRELAGKPAVFHAKLEDVCLKQIPAANADFAKKMDKSCSTIEEYRAVLRKNLESNRHASAMNHARNEIMAQLAANIEGPVAAMLIDRAGAQDLRQLQMQMQMQGISLEMYLKQTHKTMEEFNAEMRVTAEQHIRVQFGMKQIVEKEGLQMTEAELDEEIRQRALRVKKDPEEFAKGVSREGIRNRVEYQRGVEFVINHSTIVEE